MNGSRSRVSRIVGVALMCSLHPHVIADCRFYPC